MTADGCLPGGMNDHRSCQPSEHPDAEHVSAFRREHRCFSLGADQHLNQSLLAGVRLERTQDVVVRKPKYLHLHYAPPLLERGLGERVAKRRWSSGVAGQRNMVKSCQGGAVGCDGH